MSTPIVTTSRVRTLTGTQEGLIKSLLRQEIRRLHRRHAKNQERFGAQYDPERLLKREKEMTDAFLAVGGSYADLVVVGDS